MLPVLLGPVEGLGVRPGHVEGPAIRPGHLEGPRVGSVSGTTILDHVEGSGIGSVASNATLSPVEGPGVGYLAGTTASCGRTRSWVCCRSCWVLWKDQELVGSARLTGPCERICSSYSVATHDWSSKLRRRRIHQVV